MKFSKSKKTTDSSSYDLEKDSRLERRTRRSVKWLWGIFLSVGCFIALIMLLIYNGVIGYMPPIEELEDPHSKLASALYASDGTTELGRYYAGSGNRIDNDYDNISQNVIDALIATEDVRYDDHSGIDFKALGRSLFKTILMQDRSQGGGSTITQQLAKQLYSRPSKSLMERAMQKPIEWMIAIKLERFYTKQEILAMYLNRFDFLNNAVGIKTAANVYFDKEPEDLSVTEAAMLVGMLKNPSYYNPIRHAERTKDRRNTVLQLMVKNGKLDQAEADRLMATDLGLKYHRVDFKQGDAPYLREEIRRLMTAKKPVKPKQSKYSSDVAWKIAYGNYMTDSTEWENNPLYGWIEKNPKPNGQKYDLYTDGLRIYTTIDLTMQRYAEEAVCQHLGGTLQPAFFSEKRGANGPYTSPGISNEQAQKFINNAMRQTARWKSMKEAGISEEEIIKSFNEKYTMDVFAYDKSSGKWKPGSKTVTMSPRDSLIYMKTILRTGMMSMDPVTGYVKAYVGGPDYSWFQYDMAGRGKRQIGSTMKPMLYTLALEDTTTYYPCTLISNARVNYGGWTPKGGGGGMIDLRSALTISSNAVSARLLHDLQPINLIKKLRMFGVSGYAEPSLPLCLGTNDVSMKEMVGAYSAFANEGLRVDPVYVTRIEDNQGNVIYNVVPHHEEVTNPATAYRMIYLMTNVVNHGTGRGVRSYGVHAEMGGKTGTTNSNADSWFIGYTPDLVTGVWVGGEERTIRFNTMTFGQGAKAALPIFAIYMKKLYDDPKLPYSQDTKFAIPEGFKYCGDKEYKGGGGSGSSGGGATVTQTETVEGIFD